jgi:hypothetical protein
MVVLLGLGMEFSAFLRLDRIFSATLDDNVNLDFWRFIIILGYPWRLPMTYGIRPRQVLSGVACRGLLLVY